MTEVNHTHHLDAEEAYLEVSDGVYRILRTLAALNDKTPSAMLTEIIGEYFDKEPERGQLSRVL